jgi:hypothetical protein
MDVQVLVSPGELFDKLSILQIKIGKFGELGQLDKARHCQQHYAKLAMVADQAKMELRFNSELHGLYRQLRSVNENLWLHEEKIRNANPDVVTHARAIVELNDRRASLKRAIDQLMGSEITDMKSHTLPEVVP